MRISEKDAIKEAGVKIVQAAKASGVDFTGRVTDGTSDHGSTEFCSSVDFINTHGDDCQLFMYCFVDTDIIETIDSLDDIDWDLALKNAEFEIF